MTTTVASAGGAKPRAAAAGAGGLDSLQIAGLVPFSTVDWPGHMVATVFLQGCPWTCHYCHNPALQSNTAPGTLTWGQVWTLLRNRQGLLDALVLTGGEPTRQPAALAAAQAARSLGYRVGLHTAGAYPDRLSAMLPELDWVGLDIKASRPNYAQLAGSPVAARRTWQSLRLIQESGVDFEVRTTVAPGMAADTVAVARELLAAGVSRYAIQQARAEGTTTLTDAHPPGWDEEFADLVGSIRTLGFPDVIVR
ncbi:MAG: anaerobic ribonucleoside-triphosphate reductase activating protein [Beutenbergiaceae bacterium]